MQYSLYIPEPLAEKLNTRLPRSVKIAPLARLMLMGCVLSPDELTEHLKKDADDLSAYLPVLKTALLNLYAIAPVSCACHSAGKCGCHNNDNLKRRI